MLAPALFFSTVSTVNNYFYVENDKISEISEKKENRSFDYRKSFRRRCRENFTMDHYFMHSSPYIHSQILLQHRLIY